MFQPPAPDPASPRAGAGTPLTPAEVAVVFDLDNTLVDSRIDFRAMAGELADLLLEAGATQRPREELLRLPIPALIGLGEAWDRHQPAAGQASGPAAAPRLHAPGASGAPTVPPLTSRLWQVVLRHETEGMRRLAPVAGARETVQALARRGHPLAVLTNNAAPAARLALEQVGLAAYFAVVASRDDVPRLKPAPDGLHLIQAQLGGAVRRLIVVGDSWLDGKAAAEAGLPFVWFRVPGREERVRGEPIPVWREIQRLTALLELDLLAPNAHSPAAGAASEGSAGRD